MVLGCLGMYQKAAVSAPLEMATVAMGYAATPAVPVATVPVAKAMEVADTAVQAGREAATAAMERATQRPCSPCSRYRQRK